MTLKSSKFTRRSLLRGSFGAAMARSLPAPIPNAFFGGRVEYYRDTDSVFTNRPFTHHDVQKLMTNSVYGKFAISPGKVYGVRIKVTKEAIDGYRRGR